MLTKLLRIYYIFNTCLVLRNITFKVITMKYSFKRSFMYNRLKTLRVFFTETYPVLN